MLNFEHILPTKIYFGKGQLSNLKDEVLVCGSKVLLVYGGGSIKRTGLYDQVLDQLADVQVFELSGIEPNPRLTTCQKGIDICKKEKIDLVLAVGGGSTMDSAKCIAAGALYDGNVWDFYLKKAVPERALPIGCVVTLAATSSQYNHISVISNLDSNKKLPLMSVLTCPKFSICDPEYTFTVPQDQTAYGSADMFVHACDQYFSKTPGTAIQDYFGEGIMKTIIENAPLALKNPRDYDSRANLLWADCWAQTQVNLKGKIGDASTHGIEHELSAYYDITHGLGIAIVWPNWARFVYKNNIPKFVRFAKNVWSLEQGTLSDEEYALKGIERTSDFFCSMGIPKTLSEIGITTEDHFSDMADSIVASRGRGGWDKNLGEPEYLQILKNCL